MTDVADMLQRAARAAPTTSILDALMGENWAHLELDRPRRVAQVRSFLGREMLRAAGGKQSVSARVAGGNPQAVVKFIRQGGARDAAGLRAQMAYLGREGEVTLHRSENYLGVDVTPDELADAWDLPASGSGRADRTSHFLVSFPHGTDAAAAERAGRAWAEELFASGRFGDTWDYYTAFHTDRIHPHLHVVVNRRGEEEGLWLKLSRRSEFNYDVMREVQVEVAGREGIYLDATPRLARGVHDRPIPDAEIREAAREARAPEAPEHTPFTAVRNATAVLFFARRYEADAVMIEAISPGFARAMMDASDTLMRGEAIDGQPSRFTQQEMQIVSDAIQELRGEVERKFLLIDRELADLPPEIDRTMFERQAAEMKRDAAEFLPDREDLQAYRRDDREGHFQGGIAAYTPRLVEIRDAGDDKVRALAHEAGLDPVATLERFAAPDVSEGLAQTWLQAEIAERARHRQRDGLGVEPEAERDAALGLFHREAVSIYGQARAEAAKVEHDMAEISARLDAVEGVRSPHEAAEGWANGDAQFVEVVRNTLDREQRAALERGEIAALADLATEADDQARLATAYLEAARRTATGAERAHLDAGLQALDAREAELRGHERDDGHHL